MKRTELTRQQNTRSIREEKIPALCSLIHRVLNFHFEYWFQIVVNRETQVNGFNLEICFLSCFLPYAPLYVSCFFHHLLQIGSCILRLVFAIPNSVNHFSRVEIILAFSSPLVYPAALASLHFIPTSQRLMIRHRHPVYFAKEEIIRPSVTSLFSNRILYRADLCFL